MVYWNHKYPLIAGVNPITHGVILQFPSTLQLPFLQTVRYFIFDFVQTEAGLLICMCFPYRTTSRHLDISSTPLRTILSCISRPQGLLIYWYWSDSHHARWDRYGNRKRACFHTDYHFQRLCVFVVPGFVWRHFRFRFIDGVWIKNKTWGIAE